MKIVITLEEALMLNAMKRMRQITKSNASRKTKEDAVNSVFWDCMELVDKRGLN